MGDKETERGETERGETERGETERGETERGETEQYETEEESSSEDAKETESEKFVGKEEKHLETVEIAESKARLRPAQPAPLKFYKLYRFAEVTDYLLMGAGVIAGILSGLSVPLNAYLFGEVTNVLLDYVPGDEEDFYDEVDNYALSTTLLGLGVLLTSYFSIVIYSHSIQRQILKIRFMYFKATLRQEMSFYDLYGERELAARISEDLVKLEDGISDKVIQVVHALSAFAGCVILSLVEGWELALSGLSMFPIVAILTQVLSFLLKKFAKAELEAYSKAGAVVQEVLSSIKTVVAYNGQKKERQRYDKHLLEAKDNSIRKGLICGIVFGTIWLLIYVAYGMTFWFGVQLNIDQKYNPGQTVVIIFSLVVGTLNILIVAPYLEVFESARVAGGVIFWLIDRTSAIDPTSDEGLSSEIRGSIEFKNVYFSYPSRPDVPVLKGISLKINEGETVALVGASGSGKSTCIQLIQRLYDTTDGELLIDEEKISNYNVSYLRENIGVVGQEPVLFSGTVKENILYAKEDATDAEITAACEMANARVFISKLPTGFDTPLGERGALLSGGQKQRIAIARALIRNPRILLLDEATSALDNESEIKVQKALDVAAKGRTTVIVAHRLSTIRRADKIVVFSNGVIVEEGTHEMLYKREGHYFQLVNAQVRHPPEEDRDSSDENMSSAHKNLTLALDREELLTPSRVEQAPEQETHKRIPFKEILRLNAAEWKWLLTGTVGSVMIGFCYPMFALEFGEFIRILDDPKANGFNRGSYMCGGFVTIGTVMAVCTFLKIWCFTTAGENLTMRLRSQTFTALLRQEMSWFDNRANSVSVLCSRLTVDARNVQSATGISFGSIVQAGAVTILATCFALFHQWKLGLISLCLGPLLVAGLYFTFKNIVGGTKKEQKALENSARTAVEAIVNIRTVAGLGREGALYEQYRRELRPAGKAIIQQGHTKGIILGSVRCLMLLIYAVYVFYGARLMVSDDENYPNIFTVTTTFVITSSTVAQALTFLTRFQNGLASASKIYALLMRQTQIRSPDLEKVNADWTAHGDVTYENVSFKYPTRPQEQVLKNFNLDVLRGKKIALVGPSGCGKSTVIQMLERFYDPDVGKVVLDEHDIKTLKLNHLRKQLGIVSQEPVLFDRTIGENIAYGDNERVVPFGDITEAAERANAHGFISNLPLGYDTPLGENGVRLSGGQKQRLAIARALIRNPKVLLLDEATSALDTQSEQIVQDAMDKASIGRTCIVVAHRLSTIVDADRIVVLSHGTVVESGIHSDLISRKGLYRQLYSLQGRR